MDDVPRRDEVRLVHSLSVPTDASRWEDQQMRQFSEVTESIN